VQYIVSSKLKTFGLFLASLLICIFLLEFSARYIFKIKPESLTVHFSSEFEWDRAVGWRTRRNWSGKINHGRYPVPISIQTNADGFRDDDWDQKLLKAKNFRAKKILFLGDSMTYGWAEEKDFRLSEQLERLYEAQGKKAVVFNAAIPGFSPSQEYRLLPELIGRIHPDVVVLVFCANDYGDISLPYDHRYPFRVYKPFYDENGNLVFNQNVPKRPSLLFREAGLGGFSFSYLLDRLYYGFQDIWFENGGVLSVGELSLQDREWLIGDEKLMNRFPKIEKTVLALVKRTRNFVNDANARFIFLSIDSEIDQRLYQGLSPDTEYIRAPKKAEIDDATWFRIPFDGHRNLLWSLLYAKHIFAQIEKVSVEQLSTPWFREMPWPSQIALNQPESVRYLTGNWKLIGRNFGLSSFGGAILGGASKRSGSIQLRWSARAKENGTTLSVSLKGLGNVCKKKLQSEFTEHYCVFPKTANPPFLVGLSPSVATGSQPEIQFESISLSDL
jgi:hypothetical protein